MREISPDGEGVIGAPKPATVVARGSRVFVLLGVGVGRKSAEVAWSPELGIMINSASLIGASVEEARQLSRSLQEAMLIAASFRRFEEPDEWWWNRVNPNLPLEGLIANQPDWLLCAYLVKNGVDVLYSRGGVMDDTFNHERLREEALRVKTANLAAL